MAVAQLGPRAARVIGPGWGQDLFLWAALADALEALPPLPRWPTVREA